MKRNIALIGVIVCIIVAVLGLILVFADAGTEGYDTPEYYHDYGYANFGTDYYSYSNNNAARTAYNSVRIVKNQEVIVNKVLLVGGLLMFAIGAMGACGFGVVFVGTGNYYNVAVPTTTPGYTAQNQKTPQVISEKTDVNPVVQTCSPTVKSSPSQRKVYAEGEFVPGKSYRNGDEVIFENKKYVCLASGSTVWNPIQFPAQWKEIPADETKC